MLNSFISSFPSPLNKKIEESFRIINLAYAKYRKDICVCFNGGKDSTVLLDLVYKYHTKTSIGQQIPLKSFFFDSKDEFGFVYNIITFLMRNKPEESFRKGFAPELITERWSSLFKCVHFIRINFKLYEDLNDTQINEALNKIQESISWENLERILEIMWNLIETVEKD